MRLAAPSRARLVASGVALALTAGIGFLPLFGGLSYEYGIATGLLLPTIVALCTSFESFADRTALATEPPALIARALGTAAMLALLVAGVGFLHGLRAGLCDPLGGLWSFLLCPGIGALLAGALGGVSALLVAWRLPARMARRRWAMLIAGLGPLATAVSAVALFYASPAIFAYDPFVGFFSGTLYDEVVEAGMPLYTYRAGSLFTLLAVVAVAASLQRRGDRGYAVREGLGRAVLAAGIVAASASVVLALLGESLGHRTSARALAAALGGHTSGARCDVYYPTGTEKHEIELLLRDCEEEVVAVEARLGVAGPPRVTAFFFRDSAQKRKLIGAADTYIAKPWRREVYLQVLPYPHPVLGHELAHVVAGSMTKGPLFVGGAYRGLWPNPGLIEGVAVAASPDKDELLPAQWALAMKKLGLLPPLSRVFGAGFLAQNSATAYTVAGAFIAYQLDLGRGGSVARWYAGERFEQAFGRSFAAAEQEFRDALDAVSLPPEALAVAKARFEKPAIWSRPCPHVVERLREAADGCKERGDYDGADRNLGALLALDPGDASARMERAKLADLRGDGDARERILREIVAHPKFSTNWKNKAREALGDGALRAGRLAEAIAFYDAARSSVLDEDWARNLDVKRYAATSEPRARYVGRLLVGTPQRHDDAAAATLAVARRLGEGATSDGLDESDLHLLRYLVARRFMDARAFDEERELLRSLDLAKLGAITPRLHREAARMLVALACVDPGPGRAARVDAAIDAYRSAPPANDGRRLGVLRFAERCRRSP